MFFKIKYNQFLKIETPKKKLIKKENE